MKKLLSVVLLAAMMTAALASCAGEEASTTTTGNNAADTTTVGKTTTAVTPFETYIDTTDEREVAEYPQVPGDGLETLLDGKTSLTASGKIDMLTLSAVGFSAWQDYESINELFDGIDTELEWFYDQDENGDYTILKDGADPENPDGTKRGGGPGKAGGGITSPSYFYFGLTEQATISAYVLTTGNDNVNYPGRNPREWWVYGTNDQATFEACSIDGADFDATQWTELDYVYEGNVTEDNFAACGYSIDAENQGAYQYYVWVLGYTSDGVFQACELDFYVG
ncbi:MAG: hypothetical protein IJX47_08745 [Clostridia bacterium]|nr:hypothetical protein [Clostridia bacterium]